MKSNEAVKTEAANRMVRWPEVGAQTSLSRSKVNELEALGKFPARISLGHRLCVWKKSEIDQFVSDPANYKAGGR